LLQPVRLLGPDARAVLRPVLVLLLQRPGRPAAAQSPQLLPAATVPGGAGAAAAPVRVTGGQGRPGGAPAAHQPRPRLAGLVRAAAVPVAAGQRRPLRPAGAKSPGRGRITRPGRLTPGLAQAGGSDRTGPFRGLS